MSGAATPQEIAKARRWFETHFEEAAHAGHSGALPFSLTCDDAPSGDWSGWQVEGAAGDSDDDASRYAVTLKAPAGGLQVRCEVTVFRAFPVVEWVAYLSNASDDPTPIIADILPLNTTFDVAAETECVLHHARGSDCKIDDFEPLMTALPPSGAAHLEAALGRSSNVTLPFFNLQMGADGAIGAIGWTGGWAADFGREEAGPLSVTAGMQKTHLRLLPGEEIRTPSIMLLFWEGDRLHGHNMLRRFILAHHTPDVLRPPGSAPMCNAVWGENRDHQQIMKARWWKDNDIPLDIFWIDAGWYGNAPFNEASTVFNSEWGSQAGNWWPNEITYPNGLKPVGDALKEMDLGFCLWLDSERVYAGTQLATEHPDWLLGPVGENYLYNLGIPEARQALTDLISDTIAEASVTCYRQDFNTDPALFWDTADAPDRVGMSEIRHIEGMYAMWDELVERHPGLLIDNCASGGRRIDIETISRSIPLWRSDFQCYPDFDPIGIQGQTHGLAPWVPLSSGCCDRADTYAFRSALGPAIVVTTNIYEREPSAHFPVDWLRERMAEQIAVRASFYGDFYPLIPFTLDEHAWAAWQFDRPEDGEGIVLAFRRQSSPYATIEAPLSGLDAGSKYELRWAESGAVMMLEGRELMEEGLTLSIADRPGSELITYRRVD